MGGACCGNHGNIILANNQQELKQYVDEEIKSLKQRKIKKEKENEKDSHTERIEKELISGCEDISNNLGRYVLSFSDWESARNLINQYFIYVESEDFENAAKFKKTIDEKFFKDDDEVKHFNN